MKLAVLGGSFDPLHTGHLVLAEAAHTEFSYDKVLLIPAFISPFKRGGSGAAPQDRLNMIKLAIQNTPYLDYDDYEIKKGGISFTVDTVKYLYKKYSHPAMQTEGKLEGKIGLIIGDDLAAGFSSWHCSAELQTLIDIIVGHRVLKNTYDKTLSGSFPFQFSLLKNSILPISSTGVRQKIAEKTKWQHLVPEAVSEYIMRNNLYGRF